MSLSSVRSALRRMQNEDEINHEELLKRLVELVDETERIQKTADEALERAKRAQRTQ